MVDVIFFQIYNIENGLYHRKKYLQKLMNGILYHVICMSILITGGLYDTGNCSGVTGFT